MKKIAFVVANGFHLKGYVFETWLHKNIHSSTISDADYRIDTSLFSQKIIWQKKKKKKEREREK